ncbi:MAG: BrxE family protein [Chromatiaceae bacterium]
MTETATQIDLERLLKLRLAVARHGEMDAAAWWNTKGILGRHGALALRRGFPSTHHFAQARIAFAVARSRCHELFDPPGCMTLWNLPAEVEDQFVGAGVKLVQIGRGQIGPLDSVGASSARRQVQ